MLSTAFATAQIVVKDINGFNGSTDGQNCTSTPNTCTGTCTEPAWEWQWNSNPLCLNSPNTLVKGLDNKARELDWCWGNSCNPPTGGAYGGALFHASLNTQSNPDKTDTHFSWGGWFYYPDLTTVDQIEIDLNQVLSIGGSNTHTVTIIFAAQCDFTDGGGRWEFFNGWPVTSSIPCVKGTGPGQFWTNAWNHVVISAHRDPNSSCPTGPSNLCQIYYDSVYLNGVTTACSGTCKGNGADTLNWTPVGLLLENVQFGVNNSSNGSNKAYADLMTTNSPQSTQVATPIFGPQTPTQVAITTSTSGATICYTTDGTTPTANGGGTCTHGTTYTGPITVYHGETVSAMASKDGIDFDSKVATKPF